MKIALPKSDGSKKAVPILTLVDEDSSYRLTKANSASFDLKVSPGDANSSSYKLMVRILEGSEIPRQILRWWHDAQKLFAGLGAMTAATQLPILKAIMWPHVQGLFNTAMTTLAGSRYNAAMETAIVKDQTRNDGQNTEQDTVRNNGRPYYLQVADVITAMETVITGLFPRQILAKSKRCLRRELRKPLDMRVRSYYQYLVRINHEELPGMPPAFNASQSLSDEEMIDIILYGTPKSWQNEMDRQGFDPMENTPEAVIAFMENIEATEDRPDSKPKSNGKDKKDSKKAKNSSNGNPKEGKPKFYCTEHGENWTHDTKDCRTLKKKNGNKFSNKTWDRKSEEAKDKAKKDLAALIAKEVKRGVKKQLANSERKRKGDDDDSDEECALVQALSQSLDGFNYEQMENLNIDDDEISC